MRLVCAYMCNMEVPKWFPVILYTACKYCELLGCSMCRETVLRNKDENVEKTEASISTFQVMVGLNLSIGL